MELYYNSQLVTTVTTDADGVYRLNGLVPNEGTSDLYELRFRAAGAGVNTPSLGTCRLTVHQWPAADQCRHLLFGGQSPKI